MSKSVLDTIREYEAEDDRNRDDLERHNLELALCDRMIAMREEAGLTQAQLAARLGFSQGYVAKLENGAYDRCGIGTLRTFSIALGYDIDLNSLFKPSFSVQLPTAAVETLTKAVFDAKEDLFDFPAFCKSDAGKRARRRDQIAA